MNTVTTFDTIAAAYDASFSESLTGSAQRKLTRELLHSFLQDKSNLQVLEINCGTGVDALWLSSLGHSVIATDQSAEMIRMAQQKVITAPDTKQVQFLQSSFDELTATFPQQQFDLIFSNFAGLNCVSPQKFAGLNSQLNALLKKDGHLAVVLFGKYTLWEMAYYLLKGRPGQAFRRWSNKEVMVQLDQDTYQPVYYYSPAQLANMLPGMELIEKKPVGIAIPPSYMEQAMQKRPRLFRTLVRLEKKLTRFTTGSALADHTYMLLKKKSL